MAATVLQMAAARPCISHYQRQFTSRSPMSVLGAKGASQFKLASSTFISSAQSLSQRLTAAPLKFNNVVTRAMSGQSENGAAFQGLPIDLRGKKSLRELFSSKQPSLT